MKRVDVDLVAHSMLYSFFMRHTNFEDKIVEILYISMVDMIVD